MKIHIIVETKDTHSVGSLSVGKRRNYLLLGWRSKKYTKKGVNVGRIRGK